MKSAKKNNIRPEILGDWIEASLYFSTDRVSKSGIVDVLEQDFICLDQNLGNTIATDGLSEISERRRITGNYDGIEVSAKNARLSTAWRDHPVAAFFLLLSIFDFYNDFPGDARDMGEQGEIFELLVTAILKNILPSWNVLKVGWSVSDPVSVREVVTDLAGRLNTKGAADPGYWLTEHAKDGGLDVVCYKAFDDGKEAVPALFVQCASGKNWIDKIHTPNANRWQKLLDSSMKPSVALAAPFIIDGQKIRLYSCDGQIIILDRLRLLKEYRNNASSVDDELLARIVDWGGPIVAHLERLNGHI